MRIARAVLSSPPSSTKFTIRRAFPSPLPVASAPRPLRIPSRYSSSNTNPSATICRNSLLLSTISLRPRPMFSFQLDAVSSKRWKSKVPKAEERSLEGSAQFVRSSRVFLGRAATFILIVCVAGFAFLWIQSAIFLRHTLDSFQIAEPIEPTLVDHVLLDRKLKAFLANPSRGLVLAPYEIQTFLALYDDFFHLNGKVLVTNERDGFLSIIASLPRFADNFLNVKLYFNLLRDPETARWAIVLDDAEFVRFALNVNNEAFDQLNPEEEIVGGIDEFSLPPILKEIALATNSIEIRRGELFLNCRHPLTEEGIEPPLVVTTKPWDYLKPNADEPVVTDT